jgi:hypothetical protein
VHWLRNCGRLGTKEEKEKENAAPLSTLKPDRNHLGIHLRDLRGWEICREAACSCMGDHLKAAASKLNRVLT